MLNLKEISDDKIYNIKEAGDFFQVHPETVRNWIRRGQLKASKAPGSWAILGLDIKNFILGGQK